MFEFDTPDPAQRLSFSGGFTSTHFGAMRLGTSVSSGAVTRRDRATIARSGTDDYVLQIYKSSDYLLKANGEDIAVKAGDVAVIDFTRPMAMHSPRVSNVALVVSRDALAPLLKDPDAAHGMVLRGDMPRTASLRDHLLMLERDAQRFTFADTPQLTRDTTGLIAAALGASSDARETARAGLRRAMLRMMMEEIEERLGDPDLGSDWLARRFHVSRATLYRMFEPLGGVVRTIQERRMMRVFRDLSDPAHFNERVSTIAYRWGFTDHTSFGRAFKAMYDMTPRAARGEARADRDGGPWLAPDSDPAFATLNRWVAEAEAA